MKFFTALTACLFFINSYTQITVTAADFPSPDDTAMVSTSDETMLDLVTTGPSSTWDFSGISISGQSIDTFFNVTDAPFLVQAVFNNSFLNPDHVSDYYSPVSAGALSQLGQFGIGIESAMQYTNVATDSVFNTGISFVFQGQTIPAKADTIDTQYMLPMTFGDSWAGSSYINLDLNPAFDAIYRRYQTRNTIVDGWGSITTPFGTFDAIRLKSFVSSTDSIYVGQFGSWFELPTPDQIEYQWFTNGEKVPVFSVVTSDVAGNETITSIEFKDMERFFASVEEDEKLVDIYPNPAQDQINLSFNEIPKELRVMSTTGKIVYAVQPSSNTISINTTDWASGIYILETTSKNRISTSKLVIE
jgi:hypothetical protein